MANCGISKNGLHLPADSKSLSNDRCSAYSPSWDLVPHASTRICEHLAGKRILFVGPLTTYHLHTLWLDTLEHHEGHSLYCPGPEYCTFHHICIPGRNSSSYLEGRKQIFPKNNELRETHSAILQYALSTSLVAHPDKSHELYTRPIVDPRTGIRMRNYYWLRKAQKANILILSQAPISAPPSTYVHHSRRDKKGILRNIFFGPWTASRLGQELAALAFNATMSVFLPSLREALLAIQADNQTRNSLIIWHGHWALDPSCTNSGLPKHVPRIPQAWTPKRDSVDPWSYYYNIQVHIQDRMLPKILPHFNVLYLPISLSSEGALSPSSQDHHKDCIRRPKKTLEDVFFSGIYNILEHSSFSPAGRR